MTTLLLLISITLVAGGVAAYSPPAGAITLGLLLGALAVLLELGRIRERRLQPEPTE